MRINMTNDTEDKEIIENLIQNAEIKIHYIKGEKRVKAYANVILGGVMEINGFSISDSKYGDLWLQPPKYGKNYNCAFYLNDKDKKLWKLLETKIKEKYENEDIDKYLKDNL